MKWIALEGRSFNVTSRCRVEVRRHEALHARHATCFINDRQMLWFWELAAFTSGQCADRQRRY